MAVPYAIASNATGAATSIVLNVGTVQGGSGSGTSAGDAVIVFASTNTTAHVPTSCTDSKSNSYSLIASNQGEYGVAIFVALNTTALTTSDTITVNFPTSNNCGASAVGCTGIATSSATDGFNSANNAGSTTPSVTVSTRAQAGDLIITGIENAGAGGAVSWTSPSTDIIPSYRFSANDYGQVAYVIPTTTSSPSSVSGTITSARWSIVSVSLKYPSPFIITTTLPSAVSGVAYSQQVAWGGGGASYTWTSTGTMPTGLSIGSSTGIISGTPSGTAGTYNFTVKVTDGNSNVASQPLSIVLGSTLTITTTTLPGATENLAYSEALSATGGVTPYTWTISAGSLPAGLALSSGGLISGTPTATGTSSFTAKVTDSASSTATQALSIAVNAASNSIMRPPAGYAWFAAYPGAGNTDPNAGGSTSYESASMANRQLAGWYRYYNVTQNVPTANDVALVAAGRFLVMSLEPPSGGNWAEITNGTYDTQISQIAAGISNLANPCWLVWGHEPESSAFSSYGTAAQFRASFQHVANLMRAGAGTNVIMCWVIATPPSSGSYATVAAYYPGDAYVDWIGADPYDATLSKGSPSATYTPFLTWINANTLAVGGGSGSGGGIGKPLGIFETGVDNSESESATATWINAVPATLASLGIQYWSWFNSSGTLGSTVITPSSQAATALANIGANSVFNPPSSVPTGSSVPYPLGSITSNTGASTLALTVSESTNAGDAIVVYASVNNATGVLPSSCTDSASNTYTIQTATENTTRYGSAMFVALNTTALTGGTSTITVTYSSSVSAARNVCAVGVPGAQHSGAVDIVAENDNNSSTPASVGTGTLAQASEVVVAGLSSQSSAGVPVWASNMTQQIAPFQNASNQYGSMATFLPVTTSGMTLSASLPTAGKWVMQAVSLKLVSVPEITTTSLPAATIGANYSQNLTATGGVSPYTWSVSSGTLPAGLALSSGGTVSGVPQTATASDTVTFEVTDANSSTDTQAITMVVANNLSFATTSLPDGATGIAYSQGVSVSGGYGTYTFSVSSGSLPTGLSLNPSTGLISGTPTGSGTATFTIEVEDQGTNTATQPLSIDVLSGLTITTTTLPSATDGVAYSFTFEAEAGVPSYTWSVSAGSVPSGMTLSSGGVLSGTPSAPGEAAFTVEVEDADSNTAFASVTLAVVTTLIVATWSGTNSRSPRVDAADAPAWLPLDVAVSNSNGNWLFAVVSWRQDAGTNGVLSYPSSVNVTDDAGNFWIPVESVAANTGIVRCSVWMAPAARPANYVFVDPVPTPVPGSQNPIPQPYQSGITALIFETDGQVPWYEIQAQSYGYTNQGTSLTVSQTAPASGQFQVGVLAWDHNPSVVTVTATGWTALPQLQTSNGTDFTGDLIQASYYLTSAGSQVSLEASIGTGLLDFGGVIVTVSGVLDLLPFPYTQALEGWPSLVFEMATGPVLNNDPLFASGLTYWSATNCTASAVNWPLYNPWPQYQQVTSGTVSMTPSGSSTTAQIASSHVLIPSPTALYNTLGYVYSVAGFSSVRCSINWYNASRVFLTSTPGATTVIPAAEWTQLTLAQSVTPPAGAAYGQSVVFMTSASDIPSSDVLYVGYAGFGVADSYENTALDELTWTDLSGRNFTQDQITISRGIQYEQQSLEAGTLSLTLANNDAAITYGNLLSTYWPTMGDTDVPCRLRAVWPGSTTPYVPLFSGYTDQIEFAWDQGTRYGYATIEASDAWSRLTAQTLGCAEQEVLLDGPWGYWVCNNTGTNLVAGNPVTVIQTTSLYGPSGATASFTSSAISETGDQGVNCWQVQGLTKNDDGLQGIALTMYPGEQGSAFPPLTNGLTIEFWMSPTATTGNQPPVQMTLLSLWSGRGPIFQLTLDNTTDAGNGTVYITTYDADTGAATTTQCGTTTYLGTAHATLSWYFALTFSETTITVVSSPSGANYDSTSFSVNFPETAVGISLAGNAGPAAFSAVSQNIDNSNGFCNLAIYGLAITEGTVPLSRLTAHFQAANGAFGSELDVWRVARLIGYAGFTPVLAMRGLSLGQPPGADLDIVTPATDTLQQVVSDYVTNIASSTLAELYVNGAGALAYRRRLESYDRPFPQWAVGEEDTYLYLSLNINPLNTGTGTAGWITANGASVSVSGQPAVAAGPLFSPTCAVMHGNGSSGVPEIYTGSATGTPVTPGVYYRGVVWGFATAAYSSGAQLNLVWYNSSATVLETDSSDIEPFPAGSLVFLDSGYAQAPAGAAYVQFVIAVQGTPASNQLFYFADAQIGSVNAATAGGLGCAAEEAPYLIDVKLSADRALLYNYAILTQYGDQTNSTYSGRDLVFQPTSGITVIEQNLPSILERGQVPYTATSYSNNTIQAVPYYQNEPSMEDNANWIVYTEGQPQLRPETVTITPVSSPGAVETGLYAEVGDTFTFRRRHLGNPVIQILTYCSKLSQSIDVGSGQWSTQYQLSVFARGQVLKAGDPVFGTLTGGNVLGW